MDGRLSAENPKLQIPNPKSCIYDGDMSVGTYEDRRRLESLDRKALQQHQLGRLNKLLAEILPANRFYAEKLRGIQTPLQSLNEMAAWPFTTKHELVGGPNAHDLANNLTYPL